MSDRFEDQLREQLHRQAEEIREFPRSLRGRIRERIAPQRRTGLVPQLALAGALVVVAGAILVARSPQVVIKDVTTAVTQIFATRSPTATPQPFLCQDRTGGASGVSTQLTDIRLAHHAEAPGFDRIVFDFTGGIPSYDLTRQETSEFIKDASGEHVTLDGAAGVKLVFRDVDVQSFRLAEISPGLPQVRDIAPLGDFERVLSFGIGLSSSQCVRVLELANPSRLVVDVLTAPTVAASPPPTPLPTQPEATNLGPFGCQDASGGTTGAMPMQLTAVRVAHQAAGYDRIVFEFAPPAGTAAYLPAYTVSRQSSAKFVKDPSGFDVTMRGSYGMRIVFHSATGANSYAGSKDMTPGLPVVQEVEQLGDFEAVLSWGAGLSRDACIRAVELSNPVRLVLDVQTP